MRLSSVALALGLAVVLTSCSSQTQPINDLIPFIAHGTIVAVTIPESLTAAAHVPVYVHWWKQHPTEQKSYFERVQDGPRHWTVTLVTMYFPGRGYIPVDPCHASPDTLDVVVPASGTDGFTIVGNGGSISFEIAAGNGANDAGHRVLLLDRATGTPLAAKKFTYLDWAEGTVDSGMTDAFGAARTVPPPCGIATSAVDLVVSGSTCGEGSVRFEPGNVLCGRAMRTVMIYGPVPVPVADR